MSACLASTLAACACALLPQDGPERFPAPPRALSLTWEGEQGPSWIQLLEAFADATGRLVLTAEDSHREIGFANVGRGFRQKLPGSHVEGLADQRSLELPPEDVYPTVETHMRARGLVLIDLFEAGSYGAFQVVSLRTQEHNQVKRSAVYEPVERIEVYRRHPAVLVTTLVPVSEATDTYALVNALRTVLTDANLEQAVPAGTGVILTGFGPDVCERADFVRGIDRRNAAGEALDEEALKALVEERFPQTREEPK